MIDATYSLTQLQQEAPLFASGSVAIGNFDGVHKGHAHVLRFAVKQAQALSATAVALTFQPHPRAVIGESAPPSLATAAKRGELLGALGIEATISLRFDRSVAALSPEQFVKHVLVDGLRARHVVVGENFRFGHRARGTPEQLAELGRQYGYTVRGVSAVRSGDTIISSSVIRQLLRDGDVVSAADLLGREYELTGVVVPGEGRGVSLGFPTANVEPAANMLLPGSGVYIARALGKPALAVIGDKPTFQYGKTVLEVHVLDFEGDLRGEAIQVGFVRRLRDVVKFASVQELQLQMTADVNAARQYFHTETVSAL